MLSTCSVDQLSILKLLTLLTCTPNFRCSAAQRIQRKMPKFHDAHPGFFELQSAHRSLPGTLRMSSWSCRSLRACCRFVMALAMIVAWAFVWCAEREDQEQALRRQLGSRDSAAAERDWVMYSRTWVWMLRSHRSFRLVSVGISYIRVCSLTVYHQLILSLD